MINLPEANLEFEALLDYLKHSRGLDLTGYKRSTLVRRFSHRMQSLHLDSYQSYWQYLQSHSEEYLALLDDVLNNFTSFFRDPDAWAYLASHIVPKIIANQQADEPIRVWSAGCSGGQEICSALILFAEALGIEACLEKVQCYATDVDEAVLSQAKNATYSDLEVASIPQVLLAKYFEKTPKGYVFHSLLRRIILFGRHDLTKSAPMPRIDLLLCRNVLIYFNAEAQFAILVRFHFALKSTGFLLLGQAEALINRRPIFKPIHLKHRIYTKGVKLELEEHLAIKLKAPRSQAIAAPENCFWQTAFETSPVAQLAVDLGGCLVDANEQANRLFGLTIDDRNRSFENLEPGKILGLHASSISIYRNRRPVMLRDIEWSTLERTRYFDVAIVPVLNAEKRLLGITMTFQETTAFIRLT